MSSKNTQIILFNYGGGMRGLIPAHFMARIEEVTGLRMIFLILQTAIDIKTKTLLWI
ncbi:MAG: hypothetical protein AAF244_05315 [Pseudomonadota bacterium]